MTGPLDRTGEYDVRSGTGNAAAHHSVKQYLKSISTEQAEVRVSPRKATPLFFYRFYKVVLHLRDHLSRPSITAIDKYVHARDLTFFILAFFTGQRASDLGRLKTVDILQNLAGKSLFIYQRVGKSIRGSAARPIPLHPSKNPALCPVENLKLYRTLCKVMQIDLVSGFLFRTTVRHASVSSSPFLASDPLLRHGLSYI